MTRRWAPTSARRSPPKGIKVGSGRATIAVNGRGKPRTLKAGKSYLAKARLFGARKKS